MNNSMIHPLISIVVPVYNVEYYLQECLDSLINQTYQNIEIIIVNDESPDNCLQIIEDYARKDARVKYIDQKNTGLSGARNAGINLSRGDFIMFVDSDDWIDVDCLEQMSKYAANHDLVLASYYREFINKSQIRKLNCAGFYSSEFIQRRIVGLLEEELSDPSQADSLVTVWAKIYKSDIIKRYSLQFISTKEIGTSEDLLFNLEYLEYCKTCFVIDSPLYHYRRYNLNSFTSTNKKNLFLDWKNLFVKINTMIANKNEDFQQAYYNRVSLSLIGLGINEMSSSDSFVKKYKNLKGYLNDDLYVKAFSKLDFSFSPLHWRSLFYFAKIRFTFGVFVVLKVIYYIVKSKNK